MPQEARTIAILTGNPALSAVLDMVLSEHGSLRVRVFESVAALGFYLCITPIDLLICDFEQGAETALSLIPRLRLKAEQVAPDFQVIALTRKVHPAMRAGCVAARIDEVIVKPMSPRYLEERVLARLRVGARQLAARGTVAVPGIVPFPLRNNVIPFSASRQNA